MSLAINQILDGKINSIGTVQLTGLGTIVYDERVGEDSVVLMTPLTLGAADTKWRIETRRAGEYFTILTEVLEDEPRFAYVILG